MGNNLKDVVTSRSDFSLQLYEDDVCLHFGNLLGEVTYSGIG